MEMLSSPSRVMLVSLPLLVEASSTCNVHQASLLSLAGGSSARKLARHCPLMGPRALNRRPNLESSTEHATILMERFGFLRTCLRGWSILTVIWLSKSRDDNYYWNALLHKNHNLPVVGDWPLIVFFQDAKSTSLKYLPWLKFFWGSTL